MEKFKLNDNVIDKINDFMEGNGLEDNVVHVRHKLGGDIEQRLSEILEDFYNYLECHK